MLPSNEKKFCTNCVHLLGRRDKPELVDNWRCHHPNNIASNYRNLVTGTPVIVYKIEDIGKLRYGVPLSSVPDSMLCGVEGKWFEEYVRPQEPMVVQGTETGRFTPPSPVKAKSLSKIKLEDL